MTTKITASIEIKSWDEAPFDEAADVAKLTTSSVVKAYTGDITGTSATESVMAYAADGTAVFMGLERITGSIGGRPGTLVIQHVGSFEDGVAKADLTVLSGTGELAEVTGTGTFLADPNPSLTLQLG